MAGTEFPDWQVQGGGGTVTGTPPIFVTANDVSIPEADATTDGYLSAVDWVRFDAAASAGVTAVGTFDSGSASSNGAHITGADIFFQSASSSNPGMVNTTTQTFAGAKTLSSALTISPNTNQIVLGTTNTTTFTMASLTGSRIFTLPDSNSNPVIPIAAGSLKLLSAISSASVVSQKTLAGSSSIGLADSGTVITITSGTSQNLATTATINGLGSSTDTVNFTGSSATALNGIVAGYDGQKITLVNLSTAMITINNQNAGASAADRIVIPNSKSFYMLPNYSVQLAYDSTNSRWNLLNQVSANNVQTSNLGVAIAPGFLGYTQTSSIVTLTNFPTSGNYGDLTSLSLTKGMYIVSCQLSIKNNGATVTNPLIGISTTSGNSATGLTFGLNYGGVGASYSGGYGSGAIPVYYMTITSTTTVYFKYFAEYSVATPQAVGTIAAIKLD